MSRTMLTVEEKRELVAAYSAVPYGKKAQFLAEQGLSHHQFNRLRRQVCAGSLEHGLIPRRGVWVSMEENKELARLAKENEDLRQQMETLQAEKAQAERVADALGKAIELLQAGTLSASKSSNRR